MIERLSIWLERPGQWRGIGNVSAAIVLALLISLYVVAYTTKSIATYTSGNSLFDLAVFSQSFWYATKGTLFFSSLEGDISHFGRHFSPIFYMLLPFYALHRDPKTLLVLQTLALALAAIPLYLFALKRLSNPIIGLVIAGLYLANPALHDVNIVNEFHEIAFSIPLLFLAFYAAETNRWWLYAASVAGAMAVKEEIALTVAALGIYVLLFRSRRIGLVTFGAGIVWFVVVFDLVMPALRGSRAPVHLPGYGYLGNGIFGIARGILTKPRELWDVMSTEPKQQYVRWVFTPVMFIALLAPDVLIVAIPALLLILASTFPATFVIFERYVAPIVPVVFVATVVGVERLLKLIDYIASSNRIAGWLEHAGLKSVVRPTATFAILLTLVWGTYYSQQQLDKHPDRLIADGSPDPHAAIAIDFARSIPASATVVIEDHRWLAHASHRRKLYYLSGSSPAPDYLLVDSARAPITNVPQEVRQQALNDLLQSGNYTALRCEDGITLYASRDAMSRDGTQLQPYRWDVDSGEAAAEDIILIGYNAVEWNQPDLKTVIYWESLENITTDYRIHVQLIDSNRNVLSAMRSQPAGEGCPSSFWTEQQIVRAEFNLSVQTPLSPGSYELAMQLINPDGSNAGNPVRIPFAVPS